MYISGHTENQKSHMNEMHREQSRAISDIKQFKHDISSAHVFAHQVRLGKPLKIKM